MDQEEWRLERVKVRVKNMVRYFTSTDQTGTVFTGTAQGEGLGFSPPPLFAQSKKLRE